MAKNPGVDLIVNDVEVAQVQFNTGMNSQWVSIALLDADGDRIGEIRLYGPDDAGPVSMRSMTKVETIAPYIDRKLLSKA